VKIGPTRRLVVVAVLSVLTLGGPARADSEQTARAAADIAPLADTSLTPPGSSPLSLDSVQVSVPSSWFVEDPGYTCGDVQQGMVFINEPPGLPNDNGCKLPANVVELSTAPAKLPPGYHQTVINSVPAFERSTGSGRTLTETVRAVGTQVMAKGPLAPRVVATLTHSPLSVVLGSAVGSAPTGWRHVDFGGLSFSVPRQWAVQRVDWWGGCPFNIASGTLLLSTARYLSAPGCPLVPGTAGYLAGRPGMVLFAGPEVPAAPADAKCLAHNHLRICIDPPPPSTGGFSPGHELNLLTAQVRVPHRATPDQVEIGLTGSGVLPLDVFDSIRPAADGLPPEERGSSPVMRSVPATVGGLLEAVGGPPGLPVRPLPGTVRLQGPRTYTARVDRTGRYEVAVVPGRYESSGTSPLYQDGQARCNALRTVMAVAGRHTTANVYCQER